MIRNSVSALLFAGLALLGLVAWVLYLSIESYEATEHSSWSSAALHNPYLAAQKFMQQSGIRTTDVDSLVKLEQLDYLGTLFFSDANLVQTPHQLKQVMAWLQAGGNVIYGANAVEHDDDLLLREFAVAVEWRKRESGNDGDSRPLSEILREYNRQIRDGKSREEIASSVGQPQQPLTTVRFGEDVGDIEIAFDTTRVLRHAALDDTEAESQHQPFSWSGSEYGVHMMQFTVGEGLLTILSDPGIWTSYQIDRHEHAYLLWLLSSDEGSFAILRSVLRESIWTLMLRNASELLIAAGLLVAILMWRLGYRFGRLLPRDLSRRRALGEHFSALSHYLWKRRRGEYLLTPLRQAVLRRASFTLGEFANRGEARQFELIAERCDLQPEAVARAFNNNDFNETSFVVTVKLLKYIEQSL
ncbi:MAG: DUF4350 domain-containing protein [Gammaproteobacteria bacterium]|nr:DUF4350 domain-containing protein [Gammaproteobacteria bacterium]